MPSSVENHPHRNPLSFLDGGGEMGALMRAHDWNATSLGAPVGWPQALRTALRLLLNTGHPMFIFWGAEGTSFYNDAYRLSIGSERHPRALGQPALAVWQEIWSTIGPQIEQVMSGRGATWHENQLLPITRNGKLEDVYWTYSYSPIDDDTAPNGVGGVMVLVTETTGAVLAKTSAVAAHQRLQQMFEQGPSFIAMLEGAEHRFTLVNAAYTKLVGGRDVLGRTVGEALPETVAQGFVALLDSVFESGEPFSTSGARITLETPGGGPVREHFLDFVYQPVRDNDGRVSGIFVEGIDTTERTLAEKALRETEERLQQALSTGDGVGTWDFDIPNDRVVSDERFARLYGVDVDLARMGAPLVTFFQSVHPDDLPGLQAKISQIFATGGDFLAEYRLIQPDGSIRWVAAQGRCQLGPDGAPLRFPGISFDITERKAAELRQRAMVQLTDDLRDRHELADVSYAAGEILGKTLGASRVGYGTVDPRNDTLTVERDWNAPGVQSIAGLLNLRDFGSFVDDLKAGRFIAIADVREDVRTASASAALEERNARSFVNVPVVENEKTVAVLYVNCAEARAWSSFELDFIRDFAERVRTIIERARASDALQRSEARLRDLNEQLESRVAEALAGRKLLADIVESTDAFIQVADLDFNLMAINRASASEFERIFGTRPKAGDNMLDLLRNQPEHREAVRAIWQRALDGEEFTAIDQFGDPSLDRRYYEIKFNVLKDAAGNRIGAYQFVYDVTERLQDQARLAETQEALRQSQKMEAVGQLTGGIAHDFNNLLAGITGSLDMIERRAGEGRANELDRYINAAQASARRAASLTQRLLAFSRRQTLDPKPTDVNRLTSGMAELIRRTVGPAIPLEIVEAGGLWLTRIDPSQLENALLNLCINARDAMPNGGRITVETANKWLDGRAAKERELSPGQYISVCVTDTGTGMTPEVISRAFDPFFTTKPLGQGTGLGLSMIHGFVRQSGGQVRIYSEIDKGTTVCLYLPRFVGEMDATDAPEADAPAEGGHGETVLVIDDEITIRMLVVDVLVEAGYRVIEAGDGPSGLRLLNSDLRVDLLITDVGLPGGMNGRQVADAARTSRPDLKVLFITGYAENAVVGNGHLEPGMAVVTKPFEINALAGRVRDLIDS